MIDKPIQCIPSNDAQKRFLLGKEGSNTLLVVALNPSTANEISLDPTSRNVEAIAEKFGFDSEIQG